MVAKRNSDSQKERKEKRTFWNESRMELESSRAKLHKLAGATMQRGRKREEEKYKKKEWKKKFFFSDPRPTPGI